MNYSVIQEAREEGRLVGGRYRISKNRLMVVST